MRYRLRTLLLLVTVLCVGPGAFVAYQQTLARRQQAAVEHVKRWGGLAITPMPTRPAWLRAIMGDDSFGNTKRVWLNDANIGDADLVQVAHFSNLETLDLGWTNISDAGLAHLRHLTKLEDLALEGTRVTDQGILQLRNLKSLRVIWLGDTQVTAAGRARLQEHLPNARIH